MVRSELALVLGTLALSYVTPATAAPLKTMGDVGDALMACWHPPGTIKNASVTLSFSFKRDGSLIGPPRPVAIQVPGNADARKSFVQAAIKSVQDCAPLSFAPGLQNGIGGQVFTLAFPSADQPKPKSVTDR